jgi:HAMP domain-containing protein
LEQGTPKTQISTRWFFPSILLVVVLALIFFTLLMRPTQTDVGLMAIFLSVTSFISAVVGYSVYRLGWLNRSPRLQISLIAGYLLASLLTFVNVWITARLMFTSQHDLLLATVLLVFAGSIALILGVFYTQGLVLRIDKLNQAARQIAEGRFDIRIPDPGKDELAELTHSFNRMAAELETTERKKQEV